MLQGVFCHQMSLIALPAVMVPVAFIAPDRKFPLHMMVYVLFGFSLIVTVLPGFRELIVS